jgi:transcriptional regulator with XRE-family HTH domain
MPGCEDEDTGPDSLRGWRYAWMMKAQDTRCTLKQIAKVAGVSTATVSRVANGAESVSRKTRVKVECAISELRYRPNELAAELARSNAGIPRKHEPGAGSSPRTTTDALHDRKKRWKAEPETSEQLRLLEEENLRLKRLVARLRRGLETSSRIARYR